MVLASLLVIGLTTFVPELQIVSGEIFVLAVVALSSVLIGSVAYEDVQKARETTLELDETLRELLNSLIESAFQEREAVIAQSIDAASSSALLEELEQRR